MTHNQIEFFPAEEINLQSGSIRFDKSDPALALELRVPIRRLRNCRTEQQGHQFIVRDNSNHNVGELWFDRQVSTSAQDCVVVGTEEDGNMCFILLVSKIRDNHYQRIGAGKISAHYLSEDDCEGRLL